MRQKAVEESEAPKTKDFVNDLLMIFLESPDAVAIFAQRGNTERRSFRAADGGHDRCARINGGGPDFDLISAGHLPGWCVDYELDFAVLQ